MNKSFKKYKLKDVVNFFDGFAFSKNDMQEKGEFHFIKITNLINGKVELDNFKISKPNNYKKENILKGNEILIAMSGSTGKTSFNEYENVLVNQRISILRPKELLVSPRYLRHLLVNKNFETYCNNLGTGQQKNISKNDIGSFEVSIPPMEVQNEIVEVLDKFSALEAELEAELEARTKQYDYYSDILLNSENPEQVEIGSIASLVRGSSPRPISEYVTHSIDNSIPWVKISDTKIGQKYLENTRERIIIEGSLKSRIIKPDDLILSNSMSYGRTYISRIEGCIHDGWILISDFEKYYSKDYLYHLLNSKYVLNQFDNMVNSSSVKNLNIDIVKKVKIPLISVDEQERIVSILDKFSTLVTDIKEGLPAEIELRRQQYEYYRNKLLTFDKE